MTEEENSHQTPSMNFVYFKGSKRSWLLYILLNRMEYLKQKIGLSWIWLEVCYLVEVFLSISSLMQQDGPLMSWIGALHLQLKIWHMKNVGVEKSYQSIMSECLVVWLMLMFVMHRERSWMEKVYNVSILVWVKSLKPTSCMNQMHEKSSLVRMWCLKKENVGIGVRKIK